MPGGELFYLLAASAEGRSSKTTTAANGGGDAAAGGGGRQTTAGKVSWPVEDPSEFRPELGPGGQLEDLGKEAGEFRVYYEVSG